MYELEYAKTGRSTCSQTKQKIEQGALRVGMLVDVHGTEQKKWYSVDGFFEMQDRKRDKTKQARDFNEFHFCPTKEFDELLQPDQELIERKLAELHDEQLQKQRADARAKIAQEARKEKKRQQKEHEAEESDEPAAKSAKKAESAPGFQLPASELLQGSGWQKSAALKVRDYARLMHAKLPADDKEAAKVALRYVMKVRNGDAVDVAVATHELVEELGCEESAPSQAVVCPENSGLVSALTECASFAKSQGDAFKGNAFKKAADAIAELDFVVASGTEISKGEKKIPGIGKSIAAMIDEFIKSGTMQKLEAYRSM